MKLYQENGYVNIKGILEEGLPFNFVLGGRATGKTYTTLKTVKEDEIPFMFMRRTQSQTDLINKEDFSPFKSLNRDMGWDVTTSPVTKYNAAFYDGEDSPPIGYTCALSTIANVRGFDASNVRILIYDEFIPETHERPLKNEGAAFLNAYETINRNRELYGQPPLQVLALANANDLSNPIFIELGLVSKVERTMRNGGDRYIDRDRGIGVFLLKNSPISAKKAETALYKLSKNSEFAKMAIANDFANRNYDNVKPRPLREYALTVVIGELAIYKHKSKTEYYVSTHITGTAPAYKSNEYDLKRVQRDCGWLWLAYMRGTVKFEEVLCEILFTKYLG